MTLTTTLVAPIVGGLITGILCAVLLKPQKHQCQRNQRNEKDPREQYLKLLYSGCARGETYSDWMGWTPSQMVVTEQTADSYFRDR